jgi:hypothetical protein
MPLIVVGFDGSEGAARAIAASTSLLARAEALVVCVYRPVVPADGAALLCACAPAAPRRGDEDTAGQALERGHRQE